jgi:hypothetical protein
VQVEGKLVTVESGETVATFAERRRTSGLVGLKDIEGDSGPDLIRHMIKLISEDIDRQLQLLLPASR